MIERRRTHRFSVEVPISFKLPNEENKSCSSTLDISGTGISFTTKEHLSVGQEFTINVLLPNNEKILVRIQIVRIQDATQQFIRLKSPEYRVGVKIVEPIEFDERKFVKFYSGVLIDYFKPKT